MEDIEELLKGKTAQKIRIELCLGSWDHTYILYEGKFVNSMSLGLSFSPGDEIIAIIHKHKYLGNVSKNRNKRIILDSDNSVIIIQIPIKMSGTSLLEDVPEWWKDIDIDIDTDTDTEPDIFF